MNEFFKPEQLQAEPTGPDHAEQPIDSLERVLPRELVTRWVQTARSSETRRDFRLSPEQEQAYATTKAEYQEALAKAYAVFVEQYGHPKTGSVRDYLQSYKNFETWLDDNKDAFEQHFDIGLQFEMDSLLSDGRIPEELLPVVRRYLLSLTPYYEHRAPNGHKGKDSFEALCKEMGDRERARELADTLAEQAAYYFFLRRIWPSNFNKDGNLYGDNDAQSAAFPWEEFPEELRQMMKLNRFMDNSQFYEKIVDDRGFSFTEHEGGRIRALQRICDDLKNEFDFDVKPAGSTGKFVNRDGTVEEMEIW